MSANLASLLKAKLAPLEKRIAELEAQAAPKVSPPSLCITGADGAQYVAIGADAFALRSEMQDMRPGAIVRMFSAEDIKKKPRPKKPKPE